MRLMHKSALALTFAALGLAAPAADAQTQDLFVSNQTGNSILRFAGTGPGTVSTTSTTLTDPSAGSPRGLAFDARGDLFATNSNNSITEFAVGATPGTFGAATTFTDPSLNTPDGLAVDARGDLFAANYSGGTITEFAAGTTPGTFGAASTFTNPNLNRPYSLAVDARGDLFAANYLGNSITEFMAGATPGTFGAASTFTNPSLGSVVSLAVDPRGDLFAADTNNGNNITEFMAGATPGTFGATSTLTAQNYISSLAFDAQGDLFVGNSYPGIGSRIGDNEIYRFAFNPASGTFGPPQMVEASAIGQIPNGGSLSLAFGPSAPVPEASTTASFGLLALGLGGLMLAARRKKTNVKAAAPVA